MANLLDGLIDGPMAVRTSEGVAHVLRKAILGGILPPSHPLRERQLATELAVSRTPVREALFTLQGEGLVDLAPGKFARVRRVTYGDIEQIFSLRRVLESHAAHSAALAQDIQRINKAADALATQVRLGAVGSALEHAQADLAFHDAIAAATGSQLLVTLVRQVLAVTVTYRSRYKYSDEDIGRALGEHHEILDAIRAGQADKAEALMNAHIEKSTKMALARLKDLDIAP